MNYAKIGSDGMPFVRIFCLESEGLKLGSQFPPNGDNRHSGVITLEDHIVAFQPNCANYFYYKYSEARAMPLPVDG